MRVAVSDVECEHPVYLIIRLDQIAKAAIGRLPGRQRVDANERDRCPTACSACNVLNEGVSTPDTKLIEGKCVRNAEAVSRPPRKTDIGTRLGPLRLSRIGDRVQDNYVAV